MEMVTILQCTQSSSVSLYSWNSEQHHSYHFADIDDTLSYHALCSYWVCPEKQSLLEQSPRFIIEH